MDSRLPRELFCIRLPFVPQPSPMGFVLSILYFVVYYLTPAALFGSLEAYHIELILAALLTVVSIPPLTKSFILKTPQSLALIGLAVAVFLSVLIGVRWPGGAVQAFLVFIPNAFGYFLVCLHCNTKKRLQVLAVMLLFVCLFVTAHGSADLLRGVPQVASPETEGAEAISRSLWNQEHPYLLTMSNDADELFYRVRGLGEINDPNDFGQLIVCAMPLMFLLWRAKKYLLNTVLVILPVCILLLGLFLTHSRGALVALIAVVVVAGRRRIGTVPSVLLAAGMLVGAMALNFTGGRGISADAGSDRTALWGESLQLLKSQPLFGVGSGYLPDNIGHTAHNSVAVCAAELGSFGLFFWCLFLFPTMRDALAVASPLKVSEGEPIAVEESLSPQPEWKMEEIDKAEINRLGRLIILSLTGFLAAGWFLSRAFVMTLFLLGGMAEVVYQMALDRGMIAPRLPLARVLPYVGGLAVSLVLTMYILLRIVNLTH